MAEAGAIRAVLLGERRRAAAEHQAVGYVRQAAVGLVVAGWHRDQLGSKTNETQNAQKAPAGAGDAEGRRSLPLKATLRSQRARI